MSSSNPPSLVLQVTLRLIAWYFIIAVISICRMASMDLRYSARGRLLELRRLELLTSSLQSWRSTS